MKMTDYPNPAAFLLAFRDLEYELKSAMRVFSTRLPLDSQRRLDGYFKDALTRRMRFALYHVPGSGDLIAEF